MTFNPDLSTQAKEVIFSMKTVKMSHPSLTFNTVPVYKGVANKKIGIIKKLLNTLPGNSL